MKLLSDKVYIRENEEGGGYYHIFFTRKGKWCFLVKVQALVVAESVVAKEQHTDMVHSVKQALYIIVEGSETLRVEDDLHNKQIVLDTHECRDIS